MNMNDNVKFISELERLLKQKQNDYGHFDHTSYVMVEIMEKYLSIHNNQPVKIPLKFFGSAPDKIPAPNTASALDTNSPSAN